MPYAATGKFSYAPIEGGIPITEAEYQEALAGIQVGKVVSIDGGFSVAFPVEPEPDPIPEPTLAEVSEAKRNEIDRARDEAFDDGLPYDIAGIPDVVQTRTQDQINLLGLASKARRLIAAGDTDTLMPFRGLSNETYMLTAQQMDTLALDALAHIEEGSISAVGTVRTPSTMPSRLVCPRSRPGKP